MKKGCIYFHLGWTDIIICMGLVNYYKSLYDEIVVLMRSDAKQLLDFYIRSIPGVRAIYIDTDNGRYYGGFNFNSNLPIVEFNNNTIHIPPEYELLFHGAHDVHRKDKYRGYDAQPAHFKKPISHFSQLFYEFYDINFVNRILFFNVERDLQLEEDTYNKFINTHGDKYVIYHDDQSNHMHGSHHVDTKINFNNVNPEYVYVNINKHSYTFFDYIKIFQNAQEIHLIDSIWACLFYQLDAKYNVLNKKPVNVYCMRGHAEMFLRPVTLTTWNIIS
jgi:hypothetical protein